MRVDFFMGRVCRIARIWDWYKNDEYYLPKDDF
nr:MAG TPA: hypothetical protein [Caudoviricetes sp.]